MCFQYFHHKTCFPVTSKTCKNSLHLGIWHPCRRGEQVGSILFQYRASGFYFYYPDGPTPRGNMIHHVKQLIISTEDQLASLGSVKFQRRGGILHCFMWRICEGRVNEACLRLCTSGFKNKTKTGWGNYIQHQQQRPRSAAARPTQIMVLHQGLGPSNMFGPSWPPWDARGLIPGTLSQHSCPAMWGWNHKAHGMPGKFSANYFSLVNIFDTCLTLLRVLPY